MRTYKKLLIQFFLITLAVFSGCRDFIDKTIFDLSSKNSTQSKNENNINLNLNYPCDAKQLLAKNNITKIPDANAPVYIDLNRNKIIGETQRPDRDVKITYKVWKGSFTGQNKSECLIKISCDGDFYHAEGFGRYAYIVFGSNGEFKTYLSHLETIIFTGNSGMVVDSVLDLDKDGISELFVFDGNGFAGTGWDNLTIYHGTFNNTIFQRPLSLIQSFYRAGNLRVDYKTNYTINGNKITFNLELQYWRDREFEKPDKLEKYTDVYEIKNGKSIHLQGNMDDLDSYLKKNFKSNN
jgi:hypothetical protein